MRHKLSGRQLSRNAPHRHAMLRNMAASLPRHETIRTTLPKAKELRRVVAPLRDVLVVTKLFDDLGIRFRARPGGYTRILHLMRRPGDAAPMALMQLVDGPEALAATADSDEGSAKPGRARKKKAAKKAPAPKVEAAGKTPKKRTRKKKTAAA